MSCLVRGQYIVVSERRLEVGDGEAVHPKNLKERVDGLVVCVELLELLEL